MRDPGPNVSFEGDELDSLTISDSTVSSSEDRCLPKRSHLQSEDVDVTSSSSDEVFVSTWSNGVLLERAPIKILLPTFVRDSEPPYLEKLASEQNFIAGYNEAVEFVWSCLKQPREKCLRILNLCSRDLASLKKFEKFLQIFICYGKDQLQIRSVLPLSWQKSPENPATVQVIHRRWENY